MQLKRAERKQTKLKIGLFGVSGSGKTMSALRMGYGLCGDWNKIAVIDSEMISDRQFSSELYAGYACADFEVGVFNVLQLKPPYDPQRYINAIWECEKAGMEVIIIDSISHEWEGVGGVLEMVTAFGDWKVAGPSHSKFIEKIKQSPCHVIACGRSKQKHETYDTVNKQGKQTIGVKKLGIGVVSREGFDYEMIIAFDVDHSHLAVTTKDRTGLFVGRSPFLITEETGKELLAYANSGAEDTSELLNEVIHQVQACGLDAERLQEMTGFTTLKGRSAEELEQIKQAISQVA